MLFQISKAEERELNKWIEEHEKKYHPNPSYPMKIGSGAFYCYQFEPYPIGTIGTIICKTCKAHGRSKTNYEFRFMEP